jgi:polyisoprenoid-binding protein YceI
MKRTLIILLIALPFYRHAVFGQSRLTLVPAESSVMIMGTSSLHDWEEAVKQFAISATLDEASITNLSATFEVKSIESGKSIMDDKTLEALKAETYPQITLKASKLTFSNSAITGAGVLKLAGKEKTIKINAAVTESTASYLVVSGKVEVVMSEYGIEPPTAMFGTLLTGDKVTIVFNIKFKK